MLRRPSKKKPKHRRPSNKTLSPPTETHGVSCVTFLGERDEQEDRFSVTQMPDGARLLLVADGHAGAACSTFCVDFFPKALQAHWPKQNGKDCWIRAMKLACADTCSAWDRMSCPTYDIASMRCERDKRQLADHDTDTSGSTLNAVLILGDLRVVSLNLGDSRMVLSNGGRIVSSIDHSVSANTKLVARHRFKKPVVVDGRLNGILAMSHAVGDNDVDLIGVVSRTPTIFVEKCKKGDRLVVASDGLWDEMGHQDVLDTFDLMNETVHAMDKHDNTTVLWTTLW